MSDLICELVKETDSFLREKPEVFNFGLTSSFILQYCSLPGLYFAKLFLFHELNRTQEFIKENFSFM